MIKYCQKCKCVHRSKKLLKEHKIDIIELTDSEYWKLQFKKSWNRYDVKEHQKTSGSKKQLEQSNFSRWCSK